MPRQRRRFSGPEKMAVLREHLIEKVPISTVCDRHGLQPTVFYAWPMRPLDGPRSEKGLPAREGGSGYGCLNQSDGSVACLAGGRSMSTTARMLHGHEFLKCRFDVSPYLKNGQGRT